MLPAHCARAWGAAVLDRVDGAYVINAELTAGQTTYMESELYYEHEDGSPAMRDDFEGRM